MESLVERFNALVVKNNFEEIITLLIKESVEKNCHNEEYLQLWRTLIDLQEKKQHSAILETYKKYLSLLLNSPMKCNEELIYAFEKIKKNSNCNSEEELQYMNVLWENGLLEKFYSNAQVLLDRYLNSKSFVVLNGLINYLNEKNANWIKPKFYQLMIYTSLNNLELAISCADEIQLIIEKKWKKLVFKKVEKKEYFCRLLKILKSAEIKSGQFDLYLLFLQAKIYAKFNDLNYKLSNREIVKLIIAYTNDYEALLMALSNIDEALKDDIIVFIKKNKKFSLKDLKRNYPFLTKYFSPKAKIQFSKKEDNLKTEYVLKNTPVEKNYVEVQKIIDSYTDVKNKIDVNEKDFIVQIQNGVFSKNIFIKDVVVAFVELGFNNAAIELLKTSEKNIENLYLLCEIFYAQQKYLDVITEINLALSQKLVEELSIELMYLEAESYLMLKKNKMAKKIFQKILTIDPDYRQVKERISNA